MIFFVVIFLFVSEVDSILNEFVEEQQVTWRTSRDSLCSHIYLFILFYKEIKLMYIFEDIFLQ